MALIKCPECGREITDQSKQCIHCGYDIKQSKNKKKPWIVVIVVVAMIAFIIPALSKSDNIEESRDSITPYLEYIGTSLSHDEKLSLPSELYNSMDNVAFMGMQGRITYGFKKLSTKKYVNYCSWSSIEEVSESEFQKMSEWLEQYFDGEARTEFMEYSKGTTYRYFWEDTQTELCVSYGHDLFQYNPNGNVEIIWSYDYCEGIDFYQ